MDDERGDFLPPPQCTTPAAVITKHKDAAVTVLFSHIHGQRQMKIYRCHWITDDAATNQTPTNKTLPTKLGLLLSRCNDKLTKTSFQQFCVQPTNHSKDCKEHVTWTCDSVYDICSQLNPVHSSETKKNNTTTQAENSFMAPEGIHVNEHYSHKEGVLISFVSFLLGFAAATVLFLFIAWRKKLLCFNKTSEDTGIKSVKYQDGHRCQNPSYKHHQQVITNPNYTREEMDCQIPIKKLGQIDNQISRKSHDSSSYEQLQYKDEGLKNPGSKEAGCRPITETLEMIDPSRDGSHKYVDMSLSDGQAKKREHDISHPSSDHNVHYSVVLK